MVFAIRDYQYLSWGIREYHTCFSGGFCYSRVPYLSSKQGNYNDVTLSRSASSGPSITSLTFLKFILKFILFCRRFSDLGYTLRFGFVTNPVPSRVNYCRCFGCPFLSFKITGSWVRNLHKSPQNVDGEWRCPTHSPEEQTVRRLWNFAPWVIWEYTERRQTNLA